MKKRTKWALGIGALLFVVAMYTVANRRWWFKRVNAKWNYFETYTENGETGLRTVNLPERITVPQLIHAYFNGREGWTRRT